MYNGITITAHSGAEGTAPNSLEFIRKGAECGADYVEIDVRFDGKRCVLSHNKDYTNPLTLREALAEIKKYDSLLVNIDLKEFDHIPEIIKDLEEADMRERAVFTGVYMYNFHRAKKYTEDIPLFVNAFPGLGSKFKLFARLAANRIKRMGAAGINTSKKFATKVLAKATRNAGLLFSVWTINTKAEMKAFLAIKPNNITTRIPASFKD